jgi:hypothetical protein
MKRQRYLSCYPVHRERPVRNPALTGLLECDTLERDGGIRIGVEKVVRLEMFVTVRPPRIYAFRLDGDGDRGSLGMLGVVENCAVRLLKSALDTTEGEADRELDDCMAGVDGEFLNRETLDWLLRDEGE